MPRPPPSMFIRYGKFEAVAHGRWAVIGLVVLIGSSGAIAMRVFGYL